MPKLINTITKEEIVNSATDLIHKLQFLQEEAIDDLTKLGYYCGDKNYIFEPKCSWKELDNNKVKLTYELKILKRN